MASINLAMNVLITTLRVIAYRNGSKSDIGRSFSFSGNGVHLHTEAKLIKGSFFSLQFLFLFHILSASFTNCIYILI